MDELNNKRQISRAGIWARSMATFLVVIILIFASAGTLKYWQGWVFVSFYNLFTLLTIGQFGKRKDLIQERIKPGPGVKWWDKIIFNIYVPLNTIIIVISSLDNGRFHWSSPFPAWVYVISYIIMLLSYSFIMWAMFTNNFFSSRVRIQTDRGQYVVQEGPYRFVRHPGYFGVLFWQPSIPFCLGSIWGLIPAGLAVLTIVIRTYLEDKTLQKELPGYIEYTQKVRYRLIPGIW
jgi:protein-S-isoprenylcysteine O-methyltransferase Ste14